MNAPECPRGRYAIIALAIFVACVIGTGELEMPAAVGVGSYLALCSCWRDSERDKVRAYYAEKRRRQMYREIGKD
jgi:hypothetical protein